MDRPTLLRKHAVILPSYGRGTSFCNVGSGFLLRANESNTPPGLAGGLMYKKLYILLSLKVPDPSPIKIISSARFLYLFVLSNIFSVVKESNMASIQDNQAAWLAEARANPMKVGPGPDQSTPAEDELVIKVAYAAANPSEWKVRPHRRCGACIELMPNRCKTIHMCPCSTPTFLAVMLLEKL